METIQRLIRIIAKIMKLSQAAEVQFDRTMNIILKYIERIMFQCPDE